MLSEQENYNSVETLERNTEIQLTYSWLLFQLINKLKAKNQVIFITLAAVANPP